MALSREELTERVEMHDRIVEKHHERLKDLEAKLKALEAGMVLGTKADGES